MQGRQALTSTRPLQKSAAPSAEGRRGRGPGRWAAPARRARRTHARASPARPWRTACTRRTPAALPARHAVRFGRRASCAEGGAHPYEHTPAARRPAERAHARGTTVQCSARHGLRPAPGGQGDGAVSACRAAGWRGGCWRRRAPKELTRRGPGEPQELAPRRKSAKQPFRVCSDPARGYQKSVVSSESIQTGYISQYACTRTHPGAIAIGSPQTESLGYLSGFSLRSLP